MTPKTALESSARTESRSIISESRITRKEKKPMLENNLFLTSLFIGSFSLMILAFTAWMIPMVVREWRELFKKDDKDN